MKNLIFTLKMTTRFEYGAQRFWIASSMQIAYFNNFGALVALKNRPVASTFYVK